MQLTILLAEYATRRGLRSNTVTQLRDTLRVFGRFVGSPEPATAELRAETVNRFADWLAMRVRPHTVRDRINNLRLLARAARLPDAGEIRTVRVPELVVRAFSPDDMRRLLDATARLRGHFPCGVLRREWWRAHLLVKWDTGLRVSDMLALRWSDLRPNLTLCITQRKTSDVILRSVGPQAWSALTAIREPQREVCFPWHARREAYFKAFRRLVRLAGLDAGTSKYIRRAGATQVWKHHGPAAAARYLGHADGTGALAWRNYIDRSQLDENLPLPPAIG